MGTLAILADGPLGCAVQSALPPATAYATSELSLRVLRPVRAEHNDHDPFERRELGEVIGQEVWDRMSGLEVFRTQLAGDLPFPPIHFLTGAAAVFGSSRFWEAELAARDDDGAAADLDSVDAVPGSLRARV